MSSSDIKKILKFRFKKMAAFDSFDDEDFAEFEFDKENNEPVINDSVTSELEDGECQEDDKEENCITKGKKVLLSPTPDFITLPTRDAVKPLKMMYVCHT